MGGFAQNINLRSTVQGPNTFRNAFVVGCHGGACSASDVGCHRQPRGWHFTLILNPTFSGFGTEHAIQKYQVSTQIWETWSKLNMHPSNFA
jgi:hypothetical protein